MGRMSFGGSVAGSPRADLRFRDQHSDLALVKAINVLGPG